MLSVQKDVTVFREMINSFGILHSLHRITGRTIQIERPLSSVTIEQCRFYEEKSNKSSKLHIVVCLNRMRRFFPIQ